VKTNGGLRESAALRKLVGWAARSAPAWFVKAAPLLLGVFFALIVGPARRAVRRNLRWIFGVRPFFREARDIASTFAQFAACLTESLAPERPLFLAREFDVRGIELLDGLRNEGRGMLFLTAHIGPWDTSAMGLDTFSKAKVMMLMAPERDGEAGDYQDDLRSRSDVSVLRVGDSSLDAAPALTHLLEGGIVVAQMDRVRPGQDAIEARLFGQPFLVPRGLFRLAGVAGVPVIPVFSARLGFGRRLLRVTPPIQIARRPTEEQLRAHADLALAGLADHVRAFPTQWFHFSSEA
jgi:KDO2-lipid IV(A) lauroyltransferase